MGWKTCMVLIEDTTIEKLVEHRICILVGKSIDFYSATASILHQSDASVGQTDSWVVMWEPDIAHFEQLNFDEISASIAGSRRRVIALLMHSTSSVYGFTYVVAGTLQRKVITVEDELAVNIGDELPQEIEVKNIEDSEERIFALLERLTEGLNIQQLEHLDYHLIERVKQ